MSTQAQTPLVPAALDIITFGEAMMLLVADRPGPLEHPDDQCRRPFAP